MPPHTPIRLTVAGLLLSVSIVHAAPMEESIAMALESNPGLQAAMQRVEAARAAQSEARAAYLPSLFVGAQYSLTDNPTHAFMTALNRRDFNIGDPNLDFNNPDDTDHLSMTAGVRYPLIDPPRRTARAIHRLGVEAEQYATAAYQNSLIYMVMDGYYRALQARDQVQVQEERVNSLSESLRVAQERLNAGAAIITDVLNLDVQVAQAREDLIRAQHALELTVAILNTTIGADLITSDTLSAPATAMPPLRDVDHQALDAHPEMQVLRVILGMQDEEVRGARAAYAPQVSAFGSLDWDGELSTDFEQSYRVGIMAEWEWFDGFRRRSRLHQTRAQRSVMAAEWEAARSQLALDMKQAHIRAKEASARLRVAQASQESAARALAITRDQYEEGAATLADLLTAQSGLTAMQTRSTAAFYDYLAALANQERAEGELINRHAKE